MILSGLPLLLGPCDHHKPILLWFVSRLPTFLPSNTGTGRSGASATVAICSSPLSVQLRLSGTSLCLHGRTGPEHCSVCPPLPDPPTWPAPLSCHSRYPLALGPAFHSRSPSTGASGYSRPRPCMTDAPEQCLTGS